MSVDKLCSLVFRAMPICVLDSDPKARRARFIRFEQFILEPYLIFGWLVIAREFLENIVMNTTYADAEI